MGYIKRKHDEAMPENPIVCPFCGNPSRSEKYCSSCGVKFTKEVKSVAFRVKEDPRKGGIGPFSQRTANIIAIGVCAVLIALFVIATEINNANPLLGF